MFDLPYTQRPTSTNKFYTKNDLITAVRNDIVGELDAINQYNAHIHSTDNELAKRVWTSIKDEERVHVGELLTLLQKLCPDELAKLREGQREVDEIINEIGMKNC
ncbi:MAG: ubiquinone biosynthesis protein COQ7 [Clostridia bacterium]|nr:ubiquinone biosynthesis protein COQ7 [Clostridia bacterium]